MIITAVLCLLFSAGNAQKIYYVDADWKAKWKEASKKGKMN
jgi:hypothetical protein